MQHSALQAPERYREEVPEKLEQRQELREAEFAAWAPFWLQLFLLAFVIGVGLVLADLDRGGSGNGVGLGLAVAAALLVFLRIKLFFDGDRRGWGELILVDDMEELAVAIPLFTVLGLAGLIVAAFNKTGSLYVTGLALFLVSLFIILLDIKRVFDRLEGGHG